MIEYQKLTGGMERIMSKILISFFESEGTGIEGCENDLRKVYTKYTWKKGKRLTGRKDKEFLENWIEGKGMV